MICPPSFGTVPRNWYWGHGLWVDLPLDLHRHRGGSGHWSLASFPQLASFGQRPNCRWGGSIPGASAGFQVSVTPSQRVWGSSSWGHLCHCHCYVVYHNLSYFQICSSLYCLPGRIAHLWSSMCIAWFCHRHDRTSEIAKQKKNMICIDVWCSLVPRPMWVSSRSRWLRKIWLSGLSNLKWLKPRMTRRSQKKQNQDLPVLAASVMSGVCVDALAFTTLLAVSAQREQIVPWLKHAEDARNYQQENHYIKIHEATMPNSSDMNRLQGARQHSYENTRLF